MTFQAWKIPFLNSMTFQGVWESCIQQQQHPRDDGSQSDCVSRLVLQAGASGLKPQGWSLRAGASGLKPQVCWRRLKLVGQTQHVTSLANAQTSN